MNRKILTGLLSGVVLGAVGLSAAQSGSAPQTPSTARPEEAVTVIGCVQKAEPSATATEDKSPQFVLTNAMPKSAATEAKGPTGTAGTAGTSTASSRKFPLDAGEGKLTPHVGHQVEITGTFAAATAAATPGVSGVPTLKVESLRMVAASCQQ